MVATLYYAILLIVLLYALRHYCFTLNRLFGRQRHPYVEIDTADWPAITVLIAAHNEQAVIADIINALLHVDYPQDCLHIIPVNDRSTDLTESIIDDFVARYPGRIVPFHRRYGKPGKAAALKDAMELVTTEIVLIFDADYIPGKGLLRQLVAPFFDPEIGSVMGRVVPLNVGKNLLTRLLDLERSGGYQVDQQARMNLRLVPQYGGTVAGIRKSALDDIGGWNIDTLTEDTDLTYRLLLHGWKTAYQNRAECYEESPERWPVRVRQIMRWAKGHNQAMVNYSASLFRPGYLKLLERLDGLLLLFVYVMGPALLVAWLLALLMFYRGDYLPGSTLVLCAAAFTALGNFAAFFEIAASARLDGCKQRIRLLPFSFLGFLVSMISVSRAAFQQLRDAAVGAEQVWDKTERARRPEPEALPQPVAHATSAGEAA